MTSSLRVVLATHNAHKVAEFQDILGARIPGLDVVRYDGPEPVEDGVSFADNALIKARTAAAHTGLPALADDSGLCVDVMGGAPGIFSAIWCGAHGKDAENLALLLAQLADIPDEHRGAHFSATLALVVPDAAGTTGETVVEGQWHGRIAREPSGEHGFGYDPIFLPDGHEVSAAELDPTVKNAVSHRACAFEKIVPALENLASS